MGARLRRFSAGDRDLTTAGFLRDVMDWAFDSWGSGDCVSNRWEITTSASGDNTAVFREYTGGQRRERTGCATGGFP